MGNLAQQKNCSGDRDYLNSDKSSGRIRNFKGQGHSNSKQIADNKITLKETLIPIKLQMSVMNVVTDDTNQELKNQINIFEREIEKITSKI